MLRFQMLLKGLHFRLLGLPPGLHWAQSGRLRPGLPLASSRARSGLGLAPSRAPFGLYFATFLRLRSDLRHPTPGIIRGDQIIPATLRIRCLSNFQEGRSDDQRRSCLGWFTRTHSPVRDADCVPLPHRNRVSGTGTRWKLASLLSATIVVCVSLSLSVHSAR